MQDNQSTVVTTFNTVRNLHLQETLYNLYHIMSLLMALHLCKKHNIELYKIQLRVHDKEHRVLAVPSLFRSGTFKIFIKELVYSSMTH